LDYATIDVAKKVRKRRQKPKGDVVILGEDEGKYGEDYDVDYKNEELDGNVDGEDGQKLGLQGEGKKRKRGKDVKMKEFRERNF